MKFKGFHTYIRKLHLVITFLALLTLFLVLQTLILAHEYRQSMMGNVLDQFYKQHINVARQTAAGIEKFFEDIIRDLELMSSYPIVREGHKLEVREILAQFFTKNQGDVVHFFRLDASGTMTDIFPHSSAEGENFAYRTYYKETEKTLRPYVSKFIQVREKYWTLVLSCPILTEKPPGSGIQLFSGLVAATVSVDEIRKRFIDPITLAKTGYGWVVDSEGTFIIHPTSPELIGKNISTLVGEDEKNNIDNMVLRMTKGETGIGQYTYNEVNKYVAFSPFSLGDKICTVAVCAPVEEIREFMQNTFGKERILLLFVVIALTGGGLTVMFLVRRIYTIRMEEQSRSRLMEMFQSMNDGVCIVDSNYRIETINPALGDLLKKDENMAIGRPCHVVFMDKATPCQECPIEETWNRGGPTHKPKQLTPFPNRTFSADVYTLPLSRHQEERPHVLCYIKDLTREAVLKHKLTQSKKLATVGEMAAGIAHEMRNPLISIRSASEMLLESPNHTEEERTLAKVVNKEAGHLEKIIREFLLYAQPPQLKKKKVQINDIVDDILQDLRRRADYISLNIETDLAPDMPEAYLDGHKITQVLWNLIQNARDAIKAKGTLHISTRCEITRGKDPLKNLFIVVEDTGEGFDETLSQDIFKPFFTTKREGLGLGLALVQQVIDAHEGDIYVESLLGKGSRFTIRLPLIS
ncbi:MAG: cache domain-containing protein [Deltaproteobacteria bacterium]|nr:cache domain-containing protein [Deltaproteobacteria bacterium]